MTTDGFILGACTALIGVALGGVLVEWIHSGMQAREAAVQSVLAQQAATIEWQRQRMIQMQACIDELDAFIGERSDNEASAEDLGL